MKDALTDWNSRSWQCYVQLADKIDMDKETEKIKNVVMAHRNAKTDGAKVLIYIQWINGICIVIF